ncbi:MAG: magnesium and cobalt transport protein CorA, partial [Dolichospermum sp.]
MVRKIRKVSKILNNSHNQDFFQQAGTPPGTIIVDENAEQPIIFLIDYNQTELIRKKINYPEECINYLDTESVSWADVQGLGNKDIL